MQTNPDQIADLSALQALAERNLLQAVFEESDCEVIAFDASTQRLVAANSHAQKARNMAMRTLQRKTISDLVPNIPCDRVNQFLDAITRRHNQSAKIRCKHPTNSAVRFELKLCHVPGPKDTILAFVRTANNVTTGTGQAAPAENKLRNAIEALADGFVLFDANDRLVMCNDRYREIYKQSASVLVEGARHEDILRYGLGHNQFMLAYGSEDAWIARQLAARHGQNMECEQRLNDGRWLRIVDRRTVDGGRVGLRIDITHLKKQQEDLRRVARTDDLTGQLNRRGLSQKVEVMAAGLASPNRLAIFHVALDRFKTVNNTLGHEAGDFVLQHSAQILATGYPPPDAVARMGGDEFIIVKQTDKSDATILRYAKKLISRLSEPISFQHQNCHVGASIGVAFVTADNASEFACSLTGADIALHLAKTEGGNTALAFHPEMRIERIRQNDMAREVQKGLANNEFMPFFQPQIDTETNKVVGFEALIRWQHPTLGLVPACQFLPVAQRAGLTGALDDIVMDRACAAIRELIDWGMDDPKVSINLSMGQVSDPRIVSRLQGFMKAHGVHSNHLRIELLESTLLDDRSSLVVQNVHALIKAGFFVELDDFGTGHAAIATLRKFAVSRIKVDRSFVKDIDTDSELQVITAALIDLAKRLGIDALAEGVETGSEQAMLQEMGCYCAQGYLHARPMALEDVMPWLARRRESAQNSVKDDAKYPQRLI